MLALHPDFAATAATDTPAVGEGLDEDATTSAQGVAAEVA